MIKKILPFGVALLMTGVAVQSASAATSNKGVPSATTQGTPPKKVTICHRTHSTTNPYVRITVSESSIGGDANKHGGSKHNQSPPGAGSGPNVFDSTKTYAANQKKWGDIIPNVYTDGTPFTGAGAGTNYSGAGIDIFNGTNGKAGQCKKMTPREFYDSEIAAGETPTDTLTDLNEQEADENAAALEACGGTTFTGCSVTNLEATTTTVAGSATTVAGSTATTVAGSTATTVAGSTATTVAGATVTTIAGTGGLQVHTWVDANRNNKKSSSEANLEGMSVTISGPGGVTKTATTNAQGIAEFLDLAPGKWSVKSVLSKAGYAVVYDSDGTPNWKADLEVTAGAVAKASFAAAKKTSSSSATAALPKTGSSDSGMFALIASTMVLLGFALSRTRRTRA